MSTGVPVLTYRCLPGHGTANARALHDAGLATWVREPAGLAAALGSVLDGDLGRAQRAAADGLFRAPSAIDSIVALATAGSPEVPAIPHPPHPLARPRAGSPHRSAGCRWYARGRVAGIGPVPVLRSGGSRWSRRPLRRVGR